MLTAPEDPTMRYPLGDERSFVFLKAVVTNPQIEVGDYTYYHDFDDSTAFETRNVRYLFPFENDRLVIGRFCAIGHGATFVMNGASHRTDGLSTYPLRHLRREVGRGHARKLAREGRSRRRPRRLDRLPGDAHGRDHDRSRCRHRGAERGDRRRPALRPTPSSPATPPG